MLFVETPIFTAQITALVDDPSYSALQARLSLRPTQGVVVPGAGGVRKLRWAAPGRGKRGGIRVLYYWQATGGTVFMLAAFSKNRASDLSRAQIAALAKLVKEELR